MSASATLAKGTQTRDLRSDEQEFVDYCFATHKTGDADGRTVLRRFRDGNRYWREQEELCRDFDSKFKAAVSRHRPGKFLLPTSPRRLIIEFLKSNDRSDARFIVLKQYHFDIAAALLVESKSMLESQASIYEKFPLAKRYGEEIERALNAYFRTGPDLLIRVIAFLRSTPVDILDALLAAVRQQTHSHDLYQMLAARGSIRGDVALPHLLDVYRRQTESIRPFVFALSEVIHALDGPRRLDPTLGYEKRVELIKKSQYGQIVDCLDPQIRHSESHGGTEINHERGAIILTERTAEGNRRTIREYSYWEFADIARNLEHGLYMAIMAEFTLIQLSALVLITHSVEYLQLLLAIDNIAEPDEPVTKRSSGDVMFRGVISKVEPIE
jgi:hypothetical protein